MATSLHDIPGEHVAFIPMRPHAAATATETMNAFVAPFKCRVTGFSLFYDASITGQATNYTKVEITQEANSLYSETFNSGTNASTSDQGGEFNSSNQFVMDADSDPILVTWTKTGNGLDIPGALLVIKYQGA